jgi:aspartyl/glutamyl-tRNA(Asn/Gln) amidotransferase C subunit
MITQEEYKLLLKLSNLHSTSSSEDSQLIQDINILCYFVKHIQEIDVTNIEPMRSIWTGGINLNLRDDEEEKENEKLKIENQGRELLKRANVLHKEFYLVKTGIDDKAAE